MKITKRVVFAVIISFVVLGGIITYRIFSDRQKYNLCMSSSKDCGKIPIGVVFVKGLTMKEKLEVLDRVGTSFPKEYLYPTIEFSYDLEVPDIDQLRREPNVVKVDQTEGIVGAAGIVKRITLTISKDTSEAEVLRLVEKYKGELYYYDVKDGINVMVDEAKGQYYLDKLLQTKEIKDAALTINLRPN